MAQTPKQPAALHPHTLLTHAGRDPERHVGAVNIPVYRMSTVLFNDYLEWENADRGTPRAIDEQGYAYGRYGNPTTRAFARTLAALEGGDETFLTSCGLGALTAVFHTFLQHGDHALVADNVYGPTRAWFNNVGQRNGITVTFFDPRATADELATLIQDNTKLLLIESPGSITFEISDVPALTTLARKHGIISVGDNTWGTPLYFKPFERGFDISVQSVTKYIMGHSDGLMGAITCKNDLAPRLRSSLAHLGTSVNADDAYHALRGLRTLHVRLPHHQQNALLLAQELEQHPAVAQVWHPALPSHPDHALWKRDFSGSCGLFGLALQPHIQRDAVEKMVNALTLFGVGYSWGGYESLLLPSPVRGIRTATANSMPSGTILRIHVGLEHLDDLRADLWRAFDQFKLQAVA